MEKGREGIEEGIRWGGKGGRAGASWQNCHSSSSPDPKQRREAGTMRRPARGGAPAVLPMAAAGIGLKRERRPRGNRSRAHLVLGRSEEAAPR
jgi:hypothetical protein